MAPSPITSPFRIDFPYTSLTFPHVMQHYLDCTPGGGDPSGFETLPRFGFSAVGVTTAMIATWNALKQLYNPATCTFGNATLKTLVGSDYIDVYTENNAVVPTGTFANQVAWGTYLFVYGPVRKKMPVEILEGEFEGLAKFTSRAAIPAPFQAWADFYCGTGAVINISDAYVWRQFRNGGFARAFKSLTIDSNEKLRRKRGLK